MASSDGKKRLGPTKSTGPTRSLHIGSVRKRCPSTSSRIVEWPSHVTRTPETGGVAKRRGSTATVLGGSVGSMLGPPENWCPMAAQTSFTIGCGFSKCEPCHSGDFCIRASLTPVARAPRGAQHATAHAATSVARAAAISRRNCRLGGRVLFMAPKRSLPTRSWLGCLGSRRRERRAAVFRARRHRP
jgi:hypothetical protein